MLTFTTPNVGTVKRMELRVHPDPEAVAKAVAERVSALLEASPGRVSIGLAGGTTPETSYRLLASHPRHWERVDAWLSDERWVPLHHPRSNGLMAARSLTDLVGAALHRPRWSENLEPADAAAHYEATLRSLHADREPDLILLGMGEDGHTASLFPQTPALTEERRWFVANPVPQLGETRLTATFPLLYRARAIVVMAVGAHKASALRETFQGRTPAGLLATAPGAVEWHVDRAAAALV